LSDNYDGNNDGRASDPPKKAKKVPGRPFHMVQRIDRPPPLMTAQEERIARTPANGKKYSAREVADAILLGHGLLSEAAKILHTTPDVIAAYLTRYATCREAKLLAKSIMDDAAEMRLFRAVETGDPWAIQFYAKTQMRDRGYADERRMDLTVKQEAAPPPAASGAIDYDDFNRRTREALRLVARVERDGDAGPGADEDHRGAGAG
jgi:hypothetical protein